MGLVRDADGGTALIALTAARTTPSPRQLEALVEREPACLVVFEDVLHGDDALRIHLARIARARGTDLRTV